MSNLPTGFIGYPEDPEYEMAFMRAKAEGERDRARTALEAIQELHPELTVYEWDHDSGGFSISSDGEKIVIARLCLGCTPESIKEQIEDAEYDTAGNYDDVPFPCPTRKLADEALGGGERG